MAHADLVSVLVPAYNHERYVGECIGALAAQTHGPLELLVADDASTDGTAAAIERALADHSNRFRRVIFVRHDRNQGIAASLNDLLALTEGAFFYVSASDDRALPTAIETLLPVLRSDRRAALAVGDCAIIDGSGERVYWGAAREIVRDPDQAAYLTWVDYLRDVNSAGTFERRKFGRLDTLWRKNYVPNGKLIRTSAVAAVGGWRAGTLEDWDLNFRLARRFALRYVDQVLFEYRWHDGNTIKNAAWVRPAAQRTNELIRRQMRNPLLWIRIAVHRNPLRRIRVWLGARRPGRVA